MAKRNLAVFFSFGISVGQWHKSGLFDREKLIYERHLETGYAQRIDWITYDSCDERLVKKLKQEGRLHRSIHVLPAPAILSNRLGRFLYSLLAPLIHYRRLHKADVFKTNQTSGGWTAVIARLIHSKPLVYRSGYIWSHHTAVRYEGVKTRFARMIERAMLRFSNKVITTSVKARDYYKELVSKADITLVSNYIDMSLFTAKKNYDVAQPLLFVGRLEPMKNVDNIIRACAALDCKLHVYGKGTEQGRLEALAEELAAKVTFKGVVPNPEVARLHHDHSIYVLCSLSEGMPKTLIEAMASALICVGTDIPGICELIEDGKNGYLAKTTDAKAIEDAIRRAINELDGQIGARARQLVTENNSLEGIVLLEQEVLESAIATQTV